MTGRCKVLVHFGFGKTGTTALQTALGLARQDLAAAGVFVPDWQEGLGCHHQLSLLGEPGRIKVIRQWQRRPDETDDQVAARARRNLDQTIAQVKRAPPRLLLLSSELLLTDPEDGRLERLRDALGQIATDIRFVGYLREPASVFGSLLQQSARVNSHRSPLRPFTFRERLERLEATFNTKATLRAYDRSRMIGGTIVEDFSRTFLAEYIDPLAVPDASANESISAEATVLNTRFRGRHFSDCDDRLVPGASRYLLKLRKFETLYGAKSTIRLRPEIVGQVRKASVDYLWAKDRYGVTFDELDYKAMDPATPDYIGSYRDISDLIEYDQDRLRDIAAFAIGDFVRNDLKQSARQWGFFQSQGHALHFSLDRTRWSFRLSNIARNLGLTR